MKNKAFNIGLALIAAAIMIATPFLFVGAPVEAAPALAPTPVAAPDSVGAGQFFRFQPATALTADTNTSGVDITKFETVDIQYVIDHGTVNTTTLKIQYSIDNSNWTDGATLVSASAADGAAVVARVPAFGRYMRVNEDVSNSNTITITLLAVGR